MPVNYQLGKSGKAYYSATALTAVAVAADVTAATEVSNIQDLTINLQKDTVEVNSRANGGWKTKVGTLKDGSVTFKMLWKPTDAAFTAMRDAFLDDTEIFFTALDDAKTVTGAQGISGNFNVSNFTRNEPIGDVMTVDVELSPSSFTDWYIKAA